MEDKKYSITSNINKRKRFSLESLGQKALKLLLTTVISLGVLSINTNIYNYTSTVYADDTIGVSNGGTVPDDEGYRTNVETYIDGENAVINDTIVNGATKPNNIQQSTSKSSATTFAAGLPLSTIFIDTSKVGKTLGIFNPISSDPGIVYDQSGNTYNVGTERSNVVYYDPRISGARVQLNAGQVNVIPGDLFSFTFENAAILPDGTRANLKATYSNARIVVDQRYTVSGAPGIYQGAVALARGSAIRYTGTDSTNFTTTPYRAQAESLVNTEAKKYGNNYSFTNNSSTTPSIGHSIDVTYQVVDSVGSPINGTFIFAVAGINLDRDPYLGNSGNNVAKPLWYISNNLGYHFFSEALAINGGQTSTNVYVRSNDNNIPDNPNDPNNGDGAHFYPQIVLDDNGNIKFISNVQGNNDFRAKDQSYSSGFIIQADAGAGLKVTYTGHGTSANTMHTTTFASAQIWYRYTSSTGSHGKIQTTSEGNANGKLNDGSTILGPTGFFDISSMSPKDARSTYVVSEGKTITYTMTPDIGYKLSKLYIADDFDSEYTPTSYKEITFNHEAISKMKKGDTITIGTADESQWSGDDAFKGQGTLTYNEDGTYTFKFNHAKAHEGIHVEWEKTTADILVSKIWNDNNDKDGIRKDLVNSDKFPKFKLRVSSNLGKTWNDVTTNVYGDSITLQTVPSGYDDSTGKYLDGIYSIDNSPSISNANRFTWEYLPVYSYDSNGVAGNALMYQIVEIGDPWQDEYKPAEYLNSSSAFVLTSEKTNSITGWVINEDQTDHKQYALKGSVSGDGLYYEITPETGVVADEPADPQPNKDNLVEITSSDYWTADKAVPYYEGEVKNTHITNDIYVDVVKKWNDSSLLGLQTIEPEGNKYERVNIKIVLHGETEDGPVDLNKDDTTTDDLFKIITTNESDSKDDVTGNKTIEGYTIYADISITPSPQYALVKDDPTYADGYYAVNGDSIVYSTVLSPSGNLKVVKKGDGTYKKADDEFGAMFEDLPTHDNGKHITYTVKEFDESGNELDSWILTGGQLSSVKDSSDTIIGYDTTMTNTPDVDEEYVPLPIQIVKEDINSKGESNGKLEGAEFTIYTDPIREVKASVCEDEKVGSLIIYTLKNDSTKNYVEQKDSTDNKYKFYEVDNAGNISSTPADPQPSKVDLDKTGRLGGETAYTTDGNNKYVKKDDGYHLVNIDGSVDPNPATPQPDTNLIKERKDFRTGEVEKNVITTGADGTVMVNFLKTGTYYIKETKAPEGYDPDPTTYAFEVNKELRSIKKMSADEDHSTSWWQKLWDLLFGRVYPDGTTNWDPDTDNRGGTLTIYDSPITADVLVRKYWNDNDNQDGKRPGDKNNPTSTADANLPIVTLKWTIDAHTATGLTVYTDNDQENPTKYVIKNNEYYVVTSEDVTGEYEQDPATTQPTEASETDDKCNGLTVYEENGSKYVIVNNKYHEVKKDGENNYVIDAVGVIDDSPASEQPDENDLDVVKDGEWTTAIVVKDGQTVPASEKVNYVGGPVLTHQNDAYTWNTLPAYKDGKLVTYCIEETSPILDEDHTYEIEYNHTSQTHEKTFHLANTSGDKPVGLNQTVDVRNKHVSQVINIDAYKHWEDDNPNDRKPSVVKLYKIVNGVRGNVDGSGVVPVDDTDEPIYSWKDLPAYEGGYPITYLIEEESIEGYVTQYYVDYTDLDSNPVNDSGEEINAIEVKREFYTSDDELPEGKKVGDEKTKASFRIFNEKSVNVTVKKTWINGANANITFELWRTTTPESELVQSKLVSTPVSDGDNNRYYYRQENVIISPDEYRALDPAEKGKYNHRYLNNNDSTNIITVDQWNALGETEKLNYSEKYVNNNFVIITKETYDGLSDDDKALYKIEEATTWSPYSTGGKVGSEEDIIEGWEKVGEYVFTASDFDNVTTGDSNTHPFYDLPIKDKNNNAYLYRVLERPSLLRYRENQVSNTEIIDNNLNVSDGNVSLEVVKEVENRKWLNKDNFYFFVEAKEGKNVTDPDNPQTVDQNKIPLPYRIDTSTGKIEYNYTANATINSHDVGALGKAATFWDIQYKENSELYQSIGRGQTYEFYYDVYEIYDIKTVEDQEHNIETITVKTDLDTATDHTGYKDGITYDGKPEEGVFKPTVHKAKVVVTNNEGTITTDLQWEKNDEYVSGAVPVYTNTYSSKGVARAWIGKKISNRQWVDFNNETQKGDAFAFRINAIAGAALNTPGHVEDEYTTDPLMSNEDPNPQKDIQKMDEAGTFYAFGIKGNEYNNTMLNANGEAYFIYQITEADSVTYSDENYQLNNHSVDGLEYDKTKIYAKVFAKDKLDGTIHFEVNYYSDASCKDEYLLDDHKAWIYDDGKEEENSKRLLTMQEAATAASMTPAEREAAHYREIYLAYFTNSETVDIPVVKKWKDGPAIEDVTLHILRHLFAISEGPLTDDYIKTAEGNWKPEQHDGEEFWQRISKTYTAPRADFVNDNGTPDYDPGSQDTSSEKYDDKFTDLPKYVVVDGVTYRAVYRLYEDNTSDTYTRTYESINSQGDTTSDDYIYTDGDTLVVVNTVVAKNVAKPAAVKQLLNRNWLESDDFKFIISPVGKGTYNEDGSFKKIDTTDTDIPMPRIVNDYKHKEDDTTITAELYKGLNDEDKANYSPLSYSYSNEAHATSDETVVDPNGNLERLARFGEIEYTIDDLVYDAKSKHLHGDFFYEMKEDIPNGVIAINKQTLEPVEGITFGDDTRKDYYWKDNDTGIIYDGSVHTVHVKVTENRTNELQVQVSYDESKDGNVATGTQFTPVYTNRYDAVVKYIPEIDKYIMGRDWKDTDKFDFTMTALAGAPFEDSNPNDFPTDGTNNDAEREAELEKKKAVHSDVGAHVKRLFAVEGDEDDSQTLVMPGIEFRLSELNKIVTNTGELQYSNGDPVAKGMAYDQFVYAFTETNHYLDLNPEDKKSVSDLNIDVDTEYVRVTVIDRGNGTLDYKVEVFEDRYCTIPRYKPGTFVVASPVENPKKEGFYELINQEKGSYIPTKDETIVPNKDYYKGEPAENPTFINQLKRNLTITKAWADPASSDVTLRLQWSVNGTNFFDVDEAEFLDGQPATKTISKNATGDELTVTWYDLPAFADVEFEDDLDLNDEWIIYTIKEDPVEHVVTRYSTNQYTKGDSYKDTSKYFDLDSDSITNPFTSEDTDHLYVTNWREDHSDKISFGVVKQFIGKVWENENFYFEVVPVESKLGNATVPTSYEEQVAQQKQDPTVKVMPKLGTYAFANKDTDQVSVNEHAANFAPLEIKLSDLVVDPADGIAKGTFVYRIQEVIPDYAVEITEEGKTYYVKDNIKYTSDTHTVTIVAQDNGNGSIDFVVNYDDRETGQFVPVYINYAMMPTPIQGHKKWIGGLDSEHTNGSVDIVENEITSAIDKLGLQVQRKLENNLEKPETITTDDANRPLVIVWAAIEPKIKTIEGEYVDYALSTNGLDIDDPVVNLIPADRIEDNQICDAEGSNAPCYIGYHPLTRIEYEYKKYETGDGYYTIMALDGEEYVDPILHKVDKKGNAYIYSIKEEEEKVPKGYKDTYDNKNPLYITNTNVLVDSITVNKQWDDAQDGEGLRPDSVIMHLYKVVDVEQLSDDEKQAIANRIDENDFSDIWVYDGETYNSYEEAKAAAEAAQDDNPDIIHDTAEQQYQAAVQEAIDNAYADKVKDNTPLQVEVVSKEIEGDDWTSVTWDNLPVYDGKNKIKYIVIEESVAGYTTAYSVDGNNFESECKVIELEGDHETTNVDVKNSLVQETDTVEVKKVWNDDDDKDKIRPKTVTLALYEHVYNEEEGKYNDEAVLVEKRPATQADVDADPTGQIKLGDPIEVTKLEFDGNVDEQQNTVANETAPWEGKWVNLPARKNGRTVIYDVKELAADNPDLYDTTNPERRYTTVISGDQFEGYIVTNTHIPQRVYVDVTKDWNDAQFDGNPGYSRVGLTFTLTAKADEKTLIADDLGKTDDDMVKKIVATATGDALSVRFNDFPMFYNGTKITYSVAETATAPDTLDGFTVSGGTLSEVKDINTDVLEGYETTFINTPVGADVEDQLILKVIKKDDIGEEPLQGAEFTVTKKGNPDSTEVITTGADGIASYPIESAGTYYLEETKAPEGYVLDDTRYEFVVDRNLNKIELRQSIWTNLWQFLFNDMDNPFVKDSTNEKLYKLTLNNTSKVSEILVNKIWKDGNNQDDTRVKSIQYTLVAKNDEGTDITEELGINNATKNMTRIDVTEVDGNVAGTLTWDKLPMYYNGSKVKYTVTETAPDGYTVTYDANTGLTLTEGSATTVNATNTYTPVLTKLKTTKTWSDNYNQDSMRPASVEVKLYKEVVLSRTLVDTKTLTESGEWSYEWTDLPIKENGKTINYYVVETPIPDYSKSGDGYSNKVTAVATDSGTIAITNTHIPETTSVTAAKTWNDNNNQDGMRPENITVQLYKELDGLRTEVGSPAKISSTENKHTWINLPVYENGKKITYSVVEQSVTGYTTLYSPISVEAKKDNSGTITITNTHTPIEGYVNVSKTWDDANTAGRKASKIHLYKSTDGAKWKHIETLETDEAITTENDTYQFGPLPAYEGGKLITYKVVEEYVDGYSTAIDAPVTIGTDPAQIDITNSAVDIVLTKVWDDENDHDHKRPTKEVFETYIKLKADGSDVTRAYADKLTITASGNTYVLTWSALPKYTDSENPTAIVYTIEEYLPNVDYVITNPESGNSVTAVFIGNRGTASITNKHEIEKKSVSVQKIWIDQIIGADGNNIVDVTELRPDNITLTLQVYENDEWVDVESKVFAVDMDTHNKTYVDAFTELNPDLTYRVIEKNSNIPANYNRTSALDVNPIVNTLKVTEVTGTKVWVDNDIEHHNADEIILTLHYALKNSGGEYISTGTMDAHLDWVGDKYTFSNLPYADKDGNIYVYWVEETKVPEGYQDPIYDEAMPETIIVDDVEVKVSGVLNEGTITNKIEEEQVILTGEKVWLDPLDDPDVVINHKNSEDVTLAVHQVLGYVDNVIGSDEYDLNWTKEDGDSKYTISGLPRYNAQGKEYTYYVIETATDVDGQSYTTTYSGDDTAKAYNKEVITNRNTKLDDKVSVEVTKVWENDEAVAEETRKPVTITLYKTIDGARSEVGSKIIEVNKDVTEQIITWENLDKYDKDNTRKLIEYTIDETVTIDGYTSKITTSEAYKYTVTNTYDNGKTYLVVNKVWDDENNIDGIRPDHIEVKLFRNIEGGQSEEIVGKTLTLSPENNWKDAFKDLDIRDENGNTYIYTVDEDDVAGYRKHIDDKFEENKTATITNTHTPNKVQIVAEKKWDDEGKESYRDDVVLHLYGKDSSGGIVYDAGAKTIAKDSTDNKVTWTDLPERHYEDNKLTWEIIEEAIYGYTPEYKYDEETRTFTITNKFTGPTTDITATKVWDDDKNKDGKRPESVTFQLIRKIEDDEEVIDEQVITEVGNWKYTWENLDVVAEVKDGIETKQRYTSVDVPETTVYVLKDDDSIELTQEEYEQKINDGEILEEDYEPRVIPAHTEERLEEYTEDIMKEVPVLYLVKEVYEESVDDSLYKNGYRKPVVSVVDFGVFEIINSREADMTEVSVTKVWNDEDDEDGIRPDHIEVTLTQENGDMDPITVIITEKDGKWSYIFSQLPKFKSFEEPYKYVITETEVEGYTTVIEEINEDTHEWVITNTHETKDPITVEATKVWAEDESYEHMRKDVTFILMEKDGHDEHEVPDAKACTIPLDDPDKVCRWENLDNTEDGKTVLYTVREQNVPEGYVSTVTTSQEGNIVSAVVTNTFVEADKATPVTYLDTMGLGGKMIMKSTRYDTVEQAQQAADSKKDAPVDPEHSNLRFAGWDVNYDSNAGFILVAKYEKDTLVTYIDPLTGKPIVKSEYTDDIDSIEDPSDPSHSGYTFTGWKDIVDENGNHMRIATFKCNCSSPSPCPINPGQYVPPRTGVVDYLIDFINNFVS